MSEVTLEIGGRPYTVSCEDGQESHIERLGAAIEEKIASMEQLAPQRSQNLLFAALFLADDLHEARQISEASVDLVDELEKLRSERQNIESARQEVQLERDALLSERDTMLADHEALKSEFAAAKSENEKSAAQIAALNAQIEEQANAAAAFDPAGKLTALAEALEKCAGELEERASAA